MLGFLCGLRGGCRIEGGIPLKARTNGLRREEGCHNGEMRE